MSEDLQQELSLVLPDGSSRTYPVGTTALEVAQSIGPRLANDSIGAELDGKAIDLRQPLSSDGSIRIVTAKDQTAGEFIRHSAEHILADAVKRLWPDVEIDVGRRDHSEKFQYDFRYPQAFTPDDLERIEAKMREIQAEDSVFERVEVSREEAAAIFREMGESLKVERLSEIPEDQIITLYRHGDFVDLCRGPHVQRASQIGALKLIEASGVYWKGIETNEMLQRIYGTAFASKEELAQYEQQLEAARARDHRRLGAELDLFSFNAHSPATPFFHPKGAVIYNQLIDYVRQLQGSRGYDEVITPQILDVELWHTSGHYANYHEAMFFSEVDGREFAVKPMNCPTHCLIYKTHLRSYRDLPIRYSDFGRLHRYERSGVTSGLTRVRSFAQDDAHIFCTEDQIESEVLAAVDMILELYRTFEFESVGIELSTRPEKSLGAEELWKRAEDALERALKQAEIEFKLIQGEGAFYGPKVDFQVQDALGRRWQLGTVQLDYQLPERFDLNYIGADGAQHRPVMIHRAMLGSLERFIGILIEHTAGAFPLWLAPVQAVILPVSEKFSNYGARLQAHLEETGVRSQLDDRNEKLGYRIREAQLNKVPYMIVVGAREEEANEITVRLRSGGDQRKETIESFVARHVTLVKQRSTEL